MKSAIYAVIAAVLFLSALACVDWSHKRFDYPAPVISYAEPTPEQLAVLSQMQMPVRSEEE